MIHELIDGLFSFQPAWKSAWSSGVNVRTNLTARVTGLPVLSDISGWMTTNIKAKTDLISSLPVLADISGWMTTNIKGKTDLISNLPLLSDISGWLTTNIKGKTDLISNLPVLSDISSWITSNIKNKTDLISGLPVLSDISDWIVSNIKTKTDLISSLPILADITAWLTSNITNIVFDPIDEWFPLITSAINTAVVGEAGSDLLDAVTVEVKNGASDWVKRLKSFIAEILIQVIHIKLTGINVQLLKEGES